MPTLNCEISQSLAEALAARQRQAGETTGYIVMTALAEELQVEHSTLFQVSITRALIEGVNQGAVTVGEMLRHGDLGLGTFADLDGEMVVLDGVTYKVTKNGVSYPDAKAQVPFAVVTHFQPEIIVELPAVDSFEEFARRLDALRSTDNEFFAVRAEGTFKYAKARAVYGADEPLALVEAAVKQAEFEFLDASGVIVGFWIPDYAKEVHLAGWHIHFLTEDRLGGGHLLACQGAKFGAEVQHLAEFRLAIPETAAFLQANLSRDISHDLDFAEKDYLPNNGPRQD